MIVTLGICAVAVAYAAGVRRYDGRFPARPFPRRAIAWEVLALGTSFGALVALDAWADASFAAHMMQHVLLIAVVAPALVLASPVRLLLGVLPRDAARTLAHVMRSRPFSALTSPVAAWLYLLVALYGTHFTRLYELALDRPLVHAGEHLAYLATAALFWSHVFPVAPLPVRLSPPARALYVVTAAPQSAFLGLALVSARAPMYPHYARIANPFGATALDDLHAGGAVMWIAGSLFMLIVLLAVIALWAHDDHVTTERRERRAAAAPIAVIAACAAAAIVALSSPAFAAGGTDGRTVYTVHCSSCHGNDLRGGPDAPSIRGAGTADVDWWVGTGRMPAAVPWVQAQRHAPLLSPAEIRAVVTYVASVAPGGLPIPVVAAGRNLQHGRALFAENCEHCHGAYGQGNSVGSSSIAPSLAYPTNTQIGEAVRVGVGMMPKFGSRQLSDAELADVVGYVDYLRTDRQTPGGLELSATGPFGEGVVAWLVCGLGITGYAWALGSRVARKDEAIEPESVD